jgi:hypothetical protein
MQSSSQQQLTTREIQREEARMSRTMEVKKRLSPIMDRMKASLAKIQKLEESLSRSGQQPDGGRTRDCVPRGNTDNGKEEGNDVTALVPRQSSSILLKKSMEMIRRKLYKLQHMEDLLQSSEDRRQNLQHYFLQVSLSKPCLLLAASRRRDQGQSRQIVILENECAMLEQKCATVDELQLKVIDLTAKLRDFDQLQIELDDLKNHNDILELDLVQRQSKLNQLAIKCDDFECQVEQLTTMCDDLLKNLSIQEQRADKLERELMETQKLNHRAERGRSRPPCTIQSQDSADGGSTESDNDSSTLELSCQTDASSDQEQTHTNGNFFLRRVNDMKDVDSPTKTAETSSASISLPGNVTSRISISENAERSVVVPEDPEASMIERLMDKVQTLDRENAELLQSQQEVYGKFDALLQENARHATRIRELEEQLQQNQGQQSPQAISKVPNTLSAEQEKQGRGYFLKRLLTSDAQQLKQLFDGGGGAAEKARQISQDLASHVQPKQ